jgi:hypothetical protein
MSPEPPAQQNVPLPDYNGQDVCGITVHFLPCDDVKVTTSCWSRHPSTR